MIIAAWVIAALSVGVMVFVVARHFRELSLLDIGSLKDVQAKRFKDQLLIRRLERSRSAIKERMSQAFAPVSSVFSSLFSGVKDRLTALEKKYQEERRKSGRALKGEGLDKTLKRLEEGLSLLEERRYGEAEKCFVDVISADGKNLEAYRSLAWIYLHLDQLPEALETVEFLLKLKSDDLEAWALRAEVAHKTGDFATAEDLFKKVAQSEEGTLLHRFRIAEIYKETERYLQAAREMKKIVKAEPANPKYLDFLIETSILAGDLLGAKEALQALKDANPDNQKIQDFEEKIRELGDAG
ncbi:MAG: tetratricopeptide repeat protein [bacterium]